MAYNRTFAGIRAQHSAYTYEFIDEFLKHSKIERIVELGTAAGALTLYFGILGKIANWEVHSFDRVETAKDIQRAFKALDINYHVENIFSDDGLKHVQALIEEKPTFLLCDNGHKIREFNTFVPFLLSGSVVATHDWGVEIRQGDVDALCKKRKLLPYKEKMWTEPMRDLKLAVWFVP